MKSHKAGRPAIDWSSPTVLGLIGIHAVGVLALVLWASGLIRVSAGVWLLAAVTYAVRGVLVAGVYHRYFSHRSYEIIRWRRFTQFILGFAAQTSAQGGVIDWAEIHGDHHKFSDQEGDPHSPLLRGFWWAHIGWLLAPRPQTATNLTVFRKTPELLWLNRRSILAPACLALACLTIDGLSGLLIGFFLSTTVLYQTTFLVNSAAHLSGPRRYATADTSRNCWWMSFALAWGEQWHNNHHQKQWRARQGERWYEVDLTYYWLKVLEVARWIRFRRPKGTTV